MSNPIEISQIMANAKKMIEEKKAQLGLSQPKAEEKVNDDKITALKAKIAAKLASAEIQNMISTSQLNIAEQLQQKQENAKERERSLNLIIDSEGRTIDKRTGEVIQLQSRTPTLKANLKAQKRDYKTAMSGDAASGIASTIPGIASVFSGTRSSISSGAVSQMTNKETTAASTTDEQTSEKFFDARLKIKTAVRNKRKLVFNEKGKYEDIANKLRTKSKLQLLQKEINTISKKTGISAESRLTLIQPSRTTKDQIPSIEWWDFAILNDTSYDFMDQLNETELRNRFKINRLIEHPVQMKPPTMTDKKIAPAVMLTAKERKKLRRQNRAEALKEEQEKIRLGLMPPPEPKVKISNLMRVLGSEAVQDPTKVEEYVRNQMAKRQKMHEEQNAARKLTDAERAAKKKRKIMENTALGVDVSVYRVRDLNDPAIKFKIEANCNQLHMTGIVILCRSLNVIVVEGGPKQQRKFRRLMLNRIKWSEISSKKAEAEAQDEEGKKEKIVAH